MIWKKTFKHMIINERLTLTVLPSFILAIILSLAWWHFFGFGAENSIPTQAIYFFISGIIATFVLSIIVYIILSLITWWKYRKSDNY